MVVHLFITFIRMKLKAGLTGGIGSGKSLVAKIFETLGIPVFNADMAGKTLMNCDEKIKQQIQQLFGAQAYTNGKVNTAFIAGIVFHDKEKLSRLNHIIHPATIRAADEWMAKQSAPYTIKEAALIFEAGAEKNLDTVIGVYAPKQLRLKRVLERDNISLAQAEARMQHQMDEEKKMRLCHHVLINDEKSLLIPQVLALHQVLLNSTKRIL